MHYAFVHRWEARIAAAYVRRAVVCPSPQILEAVQDDRDRIQVLEAENKQLRASLAMAAASAAAVLAPSRAATAITTVGTRTRTATICRTDSPSPTIPITNFQQQSKQEEHHSPTSPLEFGPRFDPKVRRPSRIERACLAAALQTDLQTVRRLPPLILSDKEGPDFSMPGIRQRFRALEEQDYADALEAVQLETGWSLRTGQFWLCSVMQDEYETLRKMARLRRGSDQKQSQKHPLSTPLTPSKESESVALYALPAVEQFLSAFRAFVNETIIPPDSMLRLEFDNLAMMKACHRLEPSSVARVGPVFPALVLDSPILPNTVKIGSGLYAPKETTSRQQHR